MARIQPDILIARTDNKSEESLYFTQCKHAGPFTHSTYHGWKASGAFLKYTLLYCTTTQQKECNKSPDAKFIKYMKSTVCGETSNIMR